MKKTALMTLAALSMMLTGCGRQQDDKNESPAFMFWCYRQEVVSSDYHIPEMTTPARAAYIQTRIKNLPGFSGSQCNLQSRILTISYRSSEARKMNFEESISNLGFTVNNRPPDPEARLPNGVN